MAAAQRSGDLLITVLEVDDPRALSREFEDTTYDRFWRQHVRELRGFDPQAVEEGGFSGDDPLIRGRLMVKRLSKAR